MTAIYLKIENEIQGPYAPEQIEEMLAVGQITRQTMCEVEGHGIGWQPIWRYLGREPNQDIPPPIEEPHGNKKSWRDDPATDLQKEQLAFFGATWKGDITKGEASDAIDYCVN